MSILFEPQKIGNFEVKNRFVRSPTYYALSDKNGFISDASINLMKKLAKNDIGLIITGYAFVMKSGQVFPDMNGIDIDEQIPEYQKMTRAVHDLDGRIVMQIAHGGAGAHTAAGSGEDYMAVSLTDRLPDYGRKAREMTDGDIEAIIDAFGQSARRVREAGFDGVQIHGAHGYLVSQFLTPRSNRRRDRWGGSLENRMRFVIEVTRAMKKQVNDDFPVMIKLGCHDYLEDGNGLTIEEGALVAKALEKEGVCFTEVSHGTVDNSVFKKISRNITSPEGEAYLLSDARAVRKATSCPLCLVGGMRSLPVIEDIVKSGVTEFISMCRPFIREPDLIKRWKDGDDRPADCISCRGCFNTDENGRVRIYCSRL